MTHAEFEKSKRNAAEDKLFAEKLDVFLSGKLPPQDVVKIGTTPYCLRIVGAGVMPLVVPQSVLSNSMGVKLKLSGRIKSRHTETHNISVETMRNLPSALRSPICICKGNQPKTLIVVTDTVDDENHNIVVPIKLDANGLKGRINRIESIYGKKNLTRFLDDAAKINALLAVNTEKTDKCFPNFSTNIGRRLSKFETLICFDNSIAYSAENVKTFGEFFAENNKESRGKFMDNNLEAAVAEYRQNIECASGIEKLINDNFDGYRLNTDKILATAMNVFGEKRVELALASSIEHFSRDGRIAAENRNWAQVIMASQDEHNREIFINVHPLQINELTDDFRKLQKSLAEHAGQQENKEPVIFVSGQSGTNNSFDITSVGFDTEKQYTVLEFNQALKKATEKWEEKWDGLSYPNDIIIVTVENLYSEPCSFRINMADADYNSIQDIVELSPTPLHASISTEKAIEALNKAEDNARVQRNDSAEPDKTFAYSSKPYTVVHLDISTEERKNAVSEALKDIIDAYTTDNRQSNDMAQPYKNLLKDINPTTDYLHAFGEHLNCLKYALRNAATDKELCISMLDSIKQAENSLTPVVTIKGYKCIPKDTWEDHGVTYSIGQSVDDMSFYYARAADGNITRDYEYDHKPDREKVMSDHADKLAEENIDRGERIADGFADDYGDLQTSQKSGKLDDNFKHGTVCDYNFYAVRLEGAHKYANNLTFAQAQEEFSKMCAETPDSLVALGVSYKNAPPLAEYNYAMHTTMGDIDLLHGKKGTYVPIEDYKKDHALSKEPDIAEALNLLYQKFGSRTAENAKPDLFSAEHIVQSNELQDYTDKLLILRPDMLDEKFRTPDNQLFLAVGGFGCSPDKIGRKVMGEFLNDGEKTHFYREDFIGVISDEHIPDWAKDKLQQINAAKEKEAEPVSRDGSHITTNAALSATRAESRGNIMQQNTKFEVSTMSKLEGDGAKAIGTLVVNGEFAVHGVKVVEGKNGPYVSLPSEKRGGVWEEMVFPVTKEARAAINNAVLDAYQKLTASPEMTLKNEIVTPEKPVSTVYAEMHKVESETSQTKAAGQITIDKCFVVTGVKLNEGTNSEGQTKTFVAMPAKPNAAGGYDDVAHPITADFHNKVDKAVIASANNIGRYEYKGVKYAELGENPVNSKPLHPKFADKLMAQLDKAGITYQAKCAETVVISVKVADKQAFETAQKELTAKLNGRDKPQQKQEQTAGTQSHKH